MQRDNPTAARQEPSFRAECFVNPTLRDMARKVLLLSVLDLQFGYREARFFLRALRDHLHTLPL